MKMVTTYISKDIVTSVGSLVGGALSPLTDLIKKAFGNGEQGALYVPKPVVNGQQVLFQDYQMTMPVTAPGDPVGAMLDLSGNDNHATQPVSAARPIYWTDGTRHWLGLNGTSQHLISMPSDALTLPALMTAAFTPDAVDETDVNRYRLISRAYGAGTRGAIGIDGGQFAATSEGVEFTAGGTVSVGGEYVGSGVMRPESTESYLNGVFLFTGGAVTESDSHPIVIGSQPSGSSRYFDGEIYGVVLTTNPGARVAVEQYLASLAGVTLP